MTRTAQFFSRAVWQYLLAELGMGAVFIAFQMLTTPCEDYAYAAGKLTGLMFVLTLMLPTLVQISLIPAYVPLSLSMGTTRRNLFWGLQCAKLHIALGTAAAFELVQLAIQAVFHEPPLFYGAGLASVCLMVLLSTALGELMGFAGLRFGRKGILIVCIALGVFSGILGGIVGFMAASDRLDGFFDLAFAWLTKAGPFSAVAFAAVFIMAALDRRICRRFSL